MGELHITNEEGRDTVVRFNGLRPAVAPRMGKNNAFANFRRYVVATDTGLHEALAQAHGDDYSQALLDGDPEIDLEVVGRALGEGQNVYLGGDGDVMYAPPEIVEVIYEASGEERERRAPQEIAANVNEELPVHWSGKKMPRKDVVRRFVFRRHLQIAHSDGLTFDYLFSIAKELAEEDAVVLIGAGSKGKSPLVFHTNGTPYRGFLEGRIADQKYQLLLHLSNMELKAPAAEVAK